MLTPRENFIRFFKGEPCEWIPCVGDQKNFMPALVPENVARGMVIESEPFPESSYGGYDWFGVEWRYDPVVMGSMDVAPLLEDIEDLEDWESKIVFPDLDALDWAGCAAKNKEYLNTDRMLSSVIYTGFFERLISFVGFENAAVALIDEDLEDSVHALFDRLADFYIDVIKHYHDWFGVEHVLLHDDWGTQKSTMFSVSTHADFIVPYIKKVADGAHALGCFLEQHSCGKIEPLLPNMIETGIDGWRGQLINDLDGLIDEYTGKFNFGVEGWDPSAETDDQLREFVQTVIDKYKGKSVWISYPPESTCSQVILDYVHENGKL